MPEYKRDCPDLKERYDKVVVFDRNNREIPKPPFEKIRKVALPFLESLPGGKEIPLTYQKTLYDTLHSFAHELLFKPDLAEILSQLPSEVFKDEIVYVSVDLDTPNFMTVSGENGDTLYHRGKTTVWRKPEIRFSDQAVMRKIQIVPFVESKFVETKFGRLPRIAFNEVRWLRDVDKVEVKELPCGCYKTRIFWTKDMEQFKDDRITDVIDRCQVHDEIK